jgi:hypothetical protein
VASFAQTCNQLKLVKQVSADRKAELLSKLQAAEGSRLSPQEVQQRDYFEVPFEEAIELVRNRKVFRCLGGVPSCWGAHRAFRFWWWVATRLCTAKT